MGVPQHVRRDLGLLGLVAGAAMALSAALARSGEPQVHWPTTRDDDEDEALPAPASPPSAPTPSAPEPRSPAAPPTEPTFLDDPSGHALDALHAALRRAARGEGTARLVFYGGSHTASDLYTGRVRERLQARFGDAGHGFVPLVPMIDQQWAWGVRIDAAEGWEVTQIARKLTGPARHGLAGASFSTDEPDAFAAVESDSWGSGRLASRITLLYDRRPGGGSLEVWLDGRRVEVLSTDAPAPAGGSRLYSVSDGPHRIEVRARGDGPVVVYGVLFDRERDRPGVRVENLGLVGGKARHHLHWDEDQWRAFFVRRRPDLVALAYGNNELEDAHLGLEDHEAHLRAVLRRLRDAAPDASCLLVGPTDRPRRHDDGSLRPEPLVEALTDLQRAVALDTGCAFFDTLAFQGGLGAGARWLEHDPPRMREDLVHLTNEGYHAWGDALAHALQAGLE